MCEAQETRRLLSDDAEFVDGHLTLHALGADGAQPLRSLCFLRNSWSPFPKMMGYVAGTCGACNEPIVGDHISAFMMQWHLDHLLCNICGKDFSDGTQVCEGIDGFAYCPDDWQKRFCPPCGTCQKPIVGPTVNALNKSFHAESCFACFECKAKLDGKFYASKDGNLLCETHYFEETGRVCGGCGKPIIAGKVITMKAEGKFPEVRFHRDHFNCTYCHKNLAGEKYKRTKGRQYCSKCHLELFE